MDGAQVVTWSMALVRMISVMCVIYRDLNNNWTMVTDPENRPIELTL